MNLQMKAIYQALPTCACSYITFSNRKPLFKNPPGPHWPQLVTLDMALCNTPLVVDGVANVTCAHCQGRTVQATWHDTDGDGVITTADINIGEINVHAPMKQRDVHGVNARTTKAAMRTSITVLPTTTFVAPATDSINHSGLRDERNAQTRGEYETKGRGKRGHEQLEVLMEYTIPEAARQLHEYAARALAKLDAIACTTRENRLRYVRFARAYLNLFRLFKMHVYATRLEQEIRGYFACHSHGAVLAESVKPIYPLHGED
jgi:hypothetical protein